MAILCAVFQILFVAYSGLVLQLVEAYVRLGALCVARLGFGTCAYAARC